MNEKFIKACLLVAICGTFQSANASEGFKVYTVDGVENKFCLPEANLVDDIPWVPQDKPGTPKGFAFSGCYKQLNKIDEKCILPLEFETGVVHPKASFTGWLYKNFQPHAFYYRVTLEKDSKFEVSDDRKLVAVYNARLMSNWLVWHKAKPLADKIKPFLEDNDALIADCSNVGNSILCRRIVSGNDYSIKYSFSSDERVPHNVEALDKKVFAQVNQWKCTP